MARLPPVRRAVLRAVILVAAGLAALVWLFSWMPTRIEIAMPLFGPAAEPGMEDRFTLLMDTYTRLTQLVLAVFGAAAFLVSYQQQKGGGVRARAWVSLGTGLTLLTGALMFSLLGSETLLIMAAHNAVDLGLGALQYVRWALYACLVLAVACLGFFALDVALAPPRPGEGAAS